MPRSSVLSSTIIYYSPFINCYSSLVLSYFSSIPTGIFFYYPSFLPSLPSSTIFPLLLFLRPFLHLPYFLPSLPSSLNPSLLLPLPLFPILFLRLSFPFPSFIYPYFPPSVSHSLPRPPSALSTRHLHMPLTLIQFSKDSFSPSQQPLQSSSRGQTGL